MEVADRQPVGLGELPAGYGPAAALITPVRSDPTASRGFVEAELETNPDLVFRLWDSTGSGNGIVGDVRTAVLEGTIPVAALPELGSAALAEALAANDLPAVLDALAVDFVVVPAKLAESGIETCAFGKSESAPPDLYLFSTAETLDRFLAESDERLFAIRHGAAVVEYVAELASALNEVIFDAAGPHPMQLPAELFRMILEAPIEPDLELDETDFDDEIQRDPIAFNLPLEGQWASIDLTAEQSVRQEQIKRFVKRQTKSLSDRGASLRREMRDWIGRSADQAASAGGRQYAFLITSTANAAAAVSMVSFWHDLGPGVGELRPIDGVAESLLETAGPEDELVRLKVDGDEVLRHSRIRSGADEVGGKDVPLLLIDYWVSVPGPKPTAVAHLTFSTPHLPARDAITALTDTLVLHGHWTEPDDPGLQQTDEVDTLNPEGVAS